MREGGAAFHMYYEGAKFPEPVLDIRDSRLLMGPQLLQEEVSWAGTMVG